MVMPSHFYSTNTAWSIECEERARELANAKSEALRNWLKERGFERIAYTIPHRGQFILEAKSPSEKWPYHWCLCKNEEWEVPECKCKNWTIIKLTKCLDEKRWILRKLNAK